MNQRKNTALLHDLREKKLIFLHELMNIEFLHALGRETLGKIKGSLE